MRGIYDDLAFHPRPSTARAEYFGACSSVIPNPVIEEASRKLQKQGVGLTRYAECAERGTMEMKSQDAKLSALLSFHKQGAAN